MLYLIESKAIDTAVSQSPEQNITVIENLVIPSYKVLVEAERSKKITGGVIAGQRGWAFIGDFPNNDEVNKWVNSMPFWTIQNVEIKPLVSFQSQIDGATRIMQNMKSMLKK